MYCLANIIFIATLGILLHATLHACMVTDLAYNIYIAIYILQTQVDDSPNALQRCEHCQKEIVGLKVLLNYIRYAMFVAYIAESSYYK